MSELVEFLRARLDEDAAIAAEATQATTGRWTARETDWGGGTVVEDDCGALILPTERSATQYPHIARHDPARVLREVEAKREVVRLTERFADYPETFMNGSAAALEGALRMFAVAYADHPDYRPEWTA